MPWRLARRTAARVSAAAPLELRQRLTPLMWGFIAVSMFAAPLLLRAAWKLVYVRTLAGDSPQFRVARTASAPAMAAPELQVQEVPGPAPATALPHEWRTGPEEATFAALGSQSMGRFPPAAQRGGLSALAAVAARASAARRQGAAAATDPAGATSKYPARWLQRHSVAELDASRAQAAVWAEEVKEAARFSWRGYKDRAWGHDQILPVRGVAEDWYHLGLNIIDGLDTLWLLGLREEFDEATEWVEHNLNFATAQTKPDSFFEATIRLLGGLLGAHSLSGRPIFLQRARELGDRLISAWPAGADLPNGEVDIARNVSRHVSWRGNTFSTAEAGTCQLEFRYLSRHTGNPIYAQLADRAEDAIFRASPNKGLISADLNGNKDPVEIGSTISFGAHGDSYYEYLLKQYLQTSQTEPKFLEKWRLTMKEMSERLVKTSTDGYTYVAKEHGGVAVHEFDHLACFVAGSLVQGVGELPPGTVPDSYLDTAAGITKTCRAMYDTMSGLAPEIVEFSSGVKRIKPNDAFSLLRPEAAEAMYYMWYYTGDHKYRQWARDIFKGLNRSARVRFGFSAMDQVDSLGLSARDRCDSFFFAETIKYLYLIQCDPELLPLDQFVFNTEAHPLRIWRPGEAVVSS